MASSAHSLTDKQKTALEIAFSRPHYNRFHPRTSYMKPLMPLRREMMSVLQDYPNVPRSTVMWAIYEHLHRTGRHYKSWSADEWAACWRGFNHLRKSHSQQTFIVAVYRLTGLLVINEVLGNQKIKGPQLAEVLFGKTEVQAAIHLIKDTLRGIGYRHRGSVQYLRPGIAEVIFTQGTADVRAWKNPIEVAEQSPRCQRFAWALHSISVALTTLGVISQHTRPRKEIGFPVLRSIDFFENIAPEWLRASNRWHELSTHEPRTKERMLRMLYNVGRWLALHAPQVTSPGDWDVRLCAEFVASVCTWKIAQFLPVVPKTVTRAGQEMKPTSKRAYISLMRAVFRDLQEAEEIPIRFNPATALKIPRALMAQIDHAPRVLADDVWAKLLYAGINLSEDDLSTFVKRKNVGHPIELMRAVAINWLFSGIRNDELMRLELGCVVREPAVVDLTTGEQQQELCFLRVPPNKYKGSFMKPVDSVVADAIDAWERVRPPQPQLMDRKTRRLTHRLFAYRGRPVGQSFVNQRVIPLLCRKAGVPEFDSVGSISSHRARSTIASQLYNADHPLGLLELKEWLGHKKLDSVLAYTKANPKKLARAYASADYFKRNVGRITVLLDREVIESGAAARGEPYKYYDLGHGYCKYNFFSQCPHRMACVRCSFYLPRASDEARLLAARSRNEKLIEEIPLRPEEIDAATGDSAAISSLEEKLRDVPAPDMQPDDSLTA